MAGNLDLHIHTTASDGSDTPLELARKVAAAGLTPVFGENCTWFAEAKLVLVCRKLYVAPLVEEGFVDKSIVEQCYPGKDFHEMYFGEIVEALVKE